MNLCNGTCIGFDLETTGFSPVKDRIVEIAATIHGDAPASFTTLVNPGMPMPKQASEVNGITDEMLKDAPTIEKALEGLTNFINSHSPAVLVAHNAQFDVAFISAAFQRARLPLPTCNVVDTFSMAKVAHPGWMKYNLQHLKVMLKLPATEAHRALGDADSCLALYESCEQQLEKRAAEGVFPYLADPGFEGHGISVLSNEKMLDAVDIRRRWLRALQGALGTDTPQVELERIFHGSKLCEVVSLFGLVVETNRFKGTYELHLLYTRKDGKESTIPMSKLNDIRLPAARQTQMFAGAAS